MRRPLKPIMLLIGLALMRVSGGCGGAPVQAPGRSTASPSLAPRQPDPGGALGVRRPAADLPSGSSPMLAVGSRGQCGYHPEDKTDYGSCKSGYCCSSRGYCGTTSDYCKEGCQKEYGMCW
jgi:hypothetical protein